MWYNLERKYQQWQQGNTAYIQRYMEFVGLVAREYNTQIELVLKELEKFSWFKRPND